MATKSASLRNGHAKVAYAANGGGANDYGDVTLIVSQHREMAIDVPAGYGAPQAKLTTFGSTPSAAPLQSSQAQSEKLKKFQDEVKKNKDEELRIQRQQDFLRNSLRESKKLQALEQESTTAKKQQQQSVPAAVQPSGFINAAFAEEEEKHGAAVRLPLKGKGGVSGAAAASPLKGVGLEQFSGLLQALRGKLGGSNSSELRFLSQLFNNTKFQDAIGLHNRIREVAPNGHRRGPNSAGKTAAPNALAVGECLPQDYEELESILTRPDFRSLLLTHDILAAVQSSPAADNAGATVGASADDLGNDDDDDALSEKANEYGNPSVKIVRIMKSADPLGATVKNEGDAVVVQRIVKGGAAEWSSTLHEGDELLEVNNIRLRGKNINEVSDILANMTGPLSFVIAPSTNEAAPAHREEEMVHVRALFDYDPEDDTYVPCQELGISFRKGDVLHVVSQEDANWWQAYREGEEEQALAGLIPSKTFQEVMEGFRLRAIAEARRQAEQKEQQGCCGRKRGRARRTDEGNEPDEILTYEEVEKYYPEPNRKRPIVLIGPPDVGRKELREMLMQRNDGRFAAATPHTSRAATDEETDGKDYHFVPKHLFEADIRANKFVEHGQFEGHYYGTSLDAIRRVYMGGEICVLNLHPVAIKTLRDSNLMPYVVFVAPPNIERLKQNILQHGDPSKGSVSNTHLKDIIDKGREMESLYGHYIDFIITSSDYRKALDELLAEINRLEVEPQWVPAQWLKDRRLP